MAQLEAGGGAAASLASPFHFGARPAPTPRDAGVGALLIWVLLECGHVVRAMADGEPGAGIALATSAIVLLGGLVSSIAGFAFAAVAGSAFAHLAIDPLHAVQTMVVCSIAMQCYAVWKIRESISWPTLWPMVAAGAVTIPAGVWLLLHSGGFNYAVAFGAFLVIYGSCVALRRDARVFQGSAWRDAAAGALGGITGGLAGFPGPFVTIWCSLRGWDSMQQRAVYQPYILAMQIVTMPCLRWLAPLRVDLAQNLRYVPFALLGAIGGLAVFRRLTTRQFHLAVSVLLVVSGVGLIGRAA
jgi:uncharacterized membrane protein YfcA